MRCPCLQQTGIVKHFSNSLKGYSISGKNLTVQLMGASKSMEASDRIDSSANAWAAHRRGCVTSQAMYATVILLVVAGTSLTTCQATLLKLLCCALGPSW